MVYPIWLILRLVNGFAVVPLWFCYAIYRSFTMCFAMVLLCFFATVDPIVHPDVYHVVLQCVCHGLAIVLWIPHRFL